MLRRLLLRCFEGCFSNGIRLVIFFFMIRFHLEGDHTEKAPMFCSYKCHPICWWRDFSLPTSISLCCEVHTLPQCVLWKGVTTAAYARRKGNPKSCSASSVIFAVNCLVGIVVFRFYWFFKSFPLKIFGMMVRRWASKRANKTALNNFIRGFCLKRSVNKVLTLTKKKLTMMQS